VAARAIRPAPVAPADLLFTAEGADLPEDGRALPAAEDAPLHERTIDLLFGGVAAPLDEGVDRPLGVEGTPRLGEVPEGEASVASGVAVLLGVAYLAGHRLGDREEKPRVRLAAR
jgi:hypothetical protein